MGIVVRLPIRHGRTSATSSARKGKQSSAVTSPSVSALMAAANGADSQVLRFRMRLMVDRSTDTPRARMRAAMVSSSSLFSDMNSASCMSGNVYQVHKKVKPNCVPADMENMEPYVHHAHTMALKYKERPKARPKWRPCNLRAWRLHVGKTLDEVAEKMGIDHSQLSRIERGDQPWNQNVVEIAALEYGCSVVDILANLPPPKK